MSQTHINDKLPEGTYHFEITDIRIDTDIHNSPVLVAIEMRVCDGPRQGFKTCDDTNLRTANGLTILRQKVRALGVEVRQTDDAVYRLAESIDDILGKHYSIKLNYRQSKRSDTIYPYYYYNGAAGVTAYEEGRGSGVHNRKDMQVSDDELDEATRQLIAEVTCPAVSLG